MNKVYFALTESEFFFLTEVSYFKKCLLIELEILLKVYLQIIFGPKNYFSRVPAVLKKCLIPQQTLHRLVGVKECPSLIAGWNLRSSPSSEAWPFMTPKREKRFTLFFCAHFAVVALQNLFRSLLDAHTCSVSEAVHFTQKFGAESVVRLAPSHFT